MGKVIRFPVERRRTSCIICVGTGRVWSGKTRITCPGCGGTGRER